MLFAGNNVSCDRGETVKTVSLASRRLNTQLKQGVNGKGTLTAFGKFSLTPCFSGVSMKRHLDNFQ